MKFTIIFAKRGKPVAFKILETNSEKIYNEATKIAKENGYNTFYYDLQNKLPPFKLSPDMKEL